MHGFNVIDDGKRAVYITLGVDLYATTESAHVVGFNGPCTTRRGGFKEVSLESPDTPEVLFEWNSADHIGLDEVTFRKYDSIQEECTLGWDVMLVAQNCSVPCADILAGTSIQ
jgi:queuine/archaeosine tRNA-ribosyltransferase